MGLLRSFVLSGAGIVVACLLLLGIAFVTGISMTVPGVVAIESTVTGPPSASMTAGPGLVPVGLGLVALILFVTEETDSGAAVGLLLLAGDFTPSLLSPVLGAIADRTDGRRTMVVCELGQAALVALIVGLTPSVGAVL